MPSTTDPTSILQLLWKDPLQFLPLFIAFFVLILARIWVRKTFRQKFSPKPKIVQSKNNKIVLKEINIFPVKSCKGISLQKAKVGPFGLENDRRWMLYSVANKRFLTQRQIPKISLMTPSFKDQHLNLDFPNMPTLKIPINPETQQNKVSDIGLWKSVVRRHGRCLVQRSLATN